MTRARRAETIKELRLWGLASGAVVSAFALLFFTTSPFYEANDDIAFMWIADGTLYDAPSPYLIYQSIILGQALSALYRLAPGLPWYPLYLYAFHALAWLLIARGLLELPSRRWAAALFAIAFLNVGAPLMAWLQFTSTALLVGFAAIFYYAMLDRAEGRGHASAALAGAVLAAAGVIRIYYTLGAVLAFAAPLILFVALRRRKLERLAVFVLAAGLATGAAALCDHVAYGSSPAWQRWLEIHTASHEISKRPIQYSPSLPAELAELGWSINDLELANALYRTNNPEVYSPDKLDKVGALMRRNRPPLAISHSAAALMRRLFSDHARTLLALAALLMLSLISAHADERRRAVALLFAFALYWLLGLVAIAHIFERLPTRILGPTFLAPTFAAIIAFEPAGQERSPCLRRALIALALAGVLVGLSQAGRLRAAASAFQGNRRRLLTELEQLRALGDDALLVKCGQLGLNYLPVFAEHPRLNFIMLGWSVGSPPWYDKLERHGIKDLSLALIQRPNLYLLAPPHFERGMKTYMRQHYELEIEADKILELNGGDLCAFSLREARSKSKR